MSLLAAGMPGSYIIIYNIGTMTTSTRFRTGIGKGSYFTIPKGRSVKATHVKMGKKYTYIKVKDLWTYKTGWKKVNTPSWLFGPMA